MTRFLLLTVGWHPLILLCWNPPSYAQLMAFAGYECRRDHSTLLNSNATTAYILKDPPLSASLELYAAPILHVLYRPAHEEGSCADSRDQVRQFVRITHRNSVLYLFSGAIRLLPVYILTHLNIHNH